MAAAILDEVHDSYHAAHILCRAFHNLNRPGMAVMAGLRSVMLDDKKPESWSNLGLSYMLGYNLEDAARCFKRALELNPSYFPAAHNMASLYQKMGEPEKGMAWAEKAHALSPYDPGPVETMGFLNLMMGRWTPGWAQYNAGLGRSKDRTVRCFGKDDVPEWDGSPGKKVVLYAEQGMGDEICFTQFVPQMAKECELIVETCASLHSLFSESFDCKVYPTRYTDPDWVDDEKPDAKLSMSQGMEMFRGNRLAFTGKPYLKASDEKVRIWKAILSNYPGPKIGVAWNAGLPYTGAKLRALAPEDWEPLLRQPGTYVSLEYKSPKEAIDKLAERGLKVLDFSNFINNNKCYEDTAALVSALDYVVSPTTAIVDLCGALGKRCDVFIPERPFWRYYGKNVWYDSVRWIQKKGSWLETVEDYLVTTGSTYFWPDSEA